MRGGAQAHLIEADDGKFYVVKFLENPQHRRILLNEIIAGCFLDYLQIQAPRTAIVRLTAEFLAQNPEVHIQLGSRHAPVSAGWHFGSEFPGDPERIPVWDFLPDTLLFKVENLHHFLAVLVFDKWMGNADARQSIFLRARLRDWTPEPDREHHPPRQGFLALMIDHGYVFDGPNWSFADSPLQGLYFRPSVYRSVRGLDDFQPWLDRVTHFPEDIVDQALRGVPSQWFAGDESALHQLLDRLMRRRKRVPDLLEDCKKGRVNPFPEWR